MKYIEYKENKPQGTFQFPIAYYHQTPLSPRYYMTYHWHTHYEIIRILSGSFHLTLNNETKTYHAGDIIFVTSGVLHGGSPQNCIYECIVFDLESLTKGNHANSRTMREILDQSIRIDSYLSEKHPDICSILEKLCHALSEKKAGYEFVTQGCLFLLIGTILEKKLYTKANISYSSSEHLRSLKEVLSYISENYAGNISLEELAKIAGMNPRYFCRYFKSMTERTPIDYVNYYRVESACEMLSTENISIKEVAISCGFNDESYFIKTFRKYKGLTPKQFLRKNF